MKRAIQSLQTLVKAIGKPAQVGINAEKSSRDDYSF